MKRFSLLLPAAAVMTAFVLSLEIQAQAPLEVLDIGANFRKVRFPVDPKSLEHFDPALRESLPEEMLFNTYTEVASGLHFWDADAQSWRRSVEAFAEFETAMAPSKVRPK